MTKFFMAQFSKILMIIISMSLTLASCSKKVDAERVAYQAACEGEPLRKIEQREKALRDGYDINRSFNCIDKASFVAVNEVKARQEAANTPEAIAQREAERVQRFEEEKARRAEQREREAEENRIALSAIVLHDVDVNTATEKDIANVISVGPQVAAQIIEERNKRRFNDWADVVHRVVGLSAAKTAFYASICGLTVNGKSLDGAPPDSTAAAAIYQKFRRDRKN